MFKKILSMAMVLVVAVSATSLSAFAALPQTSTITAPTVYVSQGKNGLQQDVIKISVTATSNGGRFYSTDAIHIGLNRVGEGYVLIPFGKLNGTRNGVLGAGVDVKYESGGSIPPLDSDPMGTADGSGVYCYNNATFEYTIPAGKYGNYETKVVYQYQNSSVSGKEITVNAPTINVTAPAITYSKASFAVPGQYVPITKMTVDTAGNAWNTSNNKISIDAITSSDNNTVNIYVEGSNLFTNNTLNHDFKIRLINLNASNIYEPTSTISSDKLKYTVLVSGSSNILSGTYDFYYTTNATSSSPDWIPMTSGSGAVTPPPVTTGPTETTTGIPYISSISPVANSVPYYGGSVNVNVSGYNLAYTNSLLVRGVATYYNNNSYNQQTTVYTNSSSISSISSNGSAATASLSFPNNPTPSNIKYDLQYSNDNGKTWSGASSSVVLSYNPTALTSSQTTRETTTRETTAKAPAYDLSDTTRTQAKPSNVRKLIANNATDPITFVNIKNKESKELSGQYNLENMTTSERNKLKAMSELQLTKELTKATNSIASVYFNGVPASAKVAIENAIRQQKAKVITMYFGLKAKFEAPVQLYVPYSRSDFGAGSYFLYKYNPTTQRLEYVSNASVNSKGVMTCSISDTQSTYFICNQRLSV